MPYSAPTRCAEHGCGAIATAGGRCHQHQRKAWANTSHRNRTLNPGLWRKAQQHHLAYYPYCEVCGTHDDLEVDHILRPIDGGALYDDSNLQTLCTTHHKEKEIEYSRARRAGREWADEQ